MPKNLPDESGYFPLWRRFFNHPFWLEKRKFSKAEAWIDILRSVNYNDEPRKELVRGRVIEIKYGQCLMTTRYCGQRWGWPQTAVRRYLKLLFNLEQITTFCVHQMTVITVLNYNKYDIRRLGDVFSGGSVAAQWRFSDVFEIKNLRAKELEKHTKGQSETPDELRSCEVPPPPVPPPGGNGSVLRSYPYPDWLDKQLWADFHRMRARIKKPITTSRTIAGLIKTLSALRDAGHDQRQIIQASIDHCWLSFYAPKGGKPDGKEGWI